MSRITLVFLLVLGLSNISFAASDKTVQLPYNVELNRPISFSVNFKEEEEDVSIAASERFFLTAIKKSGETVIYSSVSGGAKVDEMKGLPPRLDSIITALIEQSSGLSFKYSADNSGYPLELVESEDVQKFLSKVAQGMNGWLVDFMEPLDLNSQQKKQMQAILDQGMAPLLTTDNEELSRQILQQLEIIFAVTGRNLYVDYQTVYESTRFFEDGETYLPTEELWQVDEQNKATGKISISMSSSLHPDGFAAFLERLKTNLVDSYSEEDIKAIMDIWSKMELNREARYEVDMTSGLPVSGIVYSEVTFDGKTKSQTVEFTSTY